MIKDISEITLKDIETSNLEELKHTRGCISERLDRVLEKFKGASLEDEPALYKQGRHLENILEHLDIRVFNLRRKTLLIKNEAKIACLKREVAMRERVYPNWVAKGKMRQAQADHELKVIKSILDDYIFAGFYEQEN